MDKKDRVNIVLASDNGYFIPLLVTLYSLLTSKGENTDYVVTVLVPDDFDKKNKDVINSLANDFNNSEVTFINMQDQYKDASINIQHITIPTYYRLKLPEILDADKCLYLDVDIVVRKDLLPLFGTDMGSNYLAGVKAAGYYSSEERMKNLAEYLGIAAFDQYVNAGVLLINLKQMREDNLSEQFEKYVSANFKSQDQDILNKVCYGKIMVLPPIYNSMTKYRNSSDECYEKEDYSFLPRCYSKDEWAAACSDPVIIHYADRVKPWETFGSDYSAAWWTCAFELCQKHYDLQTLLEFANRSGIKLRNDNEERYQREKSDLHSRLQQTYDEKSELNAKLKQTYEEKSELNAKLQQTYQEKSELGALLQKTYDEKSEINAKLQQTYQEKSELGALLQKTYDEKSEINAKLQQTYQEKSELGALLQKTYDEKSEINAKLQLTYKEKAERGITIKEQKKKISRQKDVISKYTGEIKDLTKSNEGHVKHEAELNAKVKDLNKRLSKSNKELKDIKNSSTYRFAKGLSKPFRFIKRKIKKSKK
ncbi:MAG: hypothetical protein J6X33_07240 [Clostridiales bacterium]|nr:hypothetical protein [Clostridiales bacterium]